MKMQRSHSPFALLLLALSLAFGPAVRAQENPPAPTPPAEKKAEAVVPTPAPSPEQKPAEALPVPTPAPVVATPPPAPVEKPASEATLAEKVDEAASKIAQKAEEQAAKTIEQAGEKTAQAQEKAAQAQEKIGQIEEKIRTKRDRMRPGGVPGGDRVRIMDDVTVPADMVVKGDTVAVMGNVQVDGEVLRDAVAVMGDNVINGHVHRNAVAVMGDLTLGPTARVDGDIVSVGGEIHRDPGAVVGGEVHVEGLEGKFTGFNNWWGKTLKLGRPLAIGAHLGWLWIVTGFSVAFYAFLALLFPQSVRRCGDKLVQEPGLSVLAAVLSLLALPVLFILLCITIIGIPIALFLLPLGVLLMVLFGKAAIYALVGRKITGDRLHLALATILGALVFIVLYLFPVLGLLLSLLVSFVGFGAVVLVMFSAKPKPAAPAAPAAVIAPVATTPTPAVSAGFVGAAAAAEATPPPAIVEVPGVPPAAPTVPPVIPVVSVAPAVSAMTLPRAGFWLRLGAAFLDFMLVMISLLLFVKGLLNIEFDGPGLMFLSVAAYHAIMWKTKGATIGGVICGLKVVRLDDRPIDWGVAIVRALTAFLSFIVAGLGFIWVAFDNEKQSWHDKVAGTTIVRVPKGTSLL